MSSIEDITKSISASAASISVIIRIITRSLDQNNEDSGILTVKAQMKDSFSIRFSDIEHNDLLTVATLLDPRFKDKFFSSPPVKTRVECAVRALAVASSPPQQDVSSVEPCESSPKRPCTEMWKIYNEIVEENGSDETNTDELETYTLEPLVPFHRQLPFLLKDCFQMPEICIAKGIG